MGGLSGLSGLSGLIAPVSGEQAVINNAVLDSADGLSIPDSANSNRIITDITAPLVVEPINGTSIHTTSEMSHTPTGDDWFGITMPGSSPPDTVTAYLLTGSYTSTLASTTGLTFITDTAQEKLFYGSEADVAVSLDGVLFETGDAAPTSSTVYLQLTNTGGSTYASFTLYLDGP